MEGEQHREEEIQTPEGPDELEKRGGYVPTRPPPPVPVREPPPPPETPRTRTPSPPPEPAEEEGH